MAAALAAEQLDVADDLDAGRARADHRPVRLRVGERHAGREHQRGEALPVGDAQILDRNAGAPRRRDRRRAVVPGGDTGAAGDQRQRGRAAALAEAEDRDVLVRRKLVTGIIARVT